MARFFISFFAIKGFASLFKLFLIPVAIFVIGSGLTDYAQNAPDGYSLIEYLNAKESPGEIR